MMMQTRAYLRSLMIFFAVLFPFNGWASPASLSYQGKIEASDNTPLEYNNVSFIFKVTNSAGTCIIYQEQISGYDMTNSKGVFDVPIGSGSVTYPSDGSLTILDVFDNTKTYTCSGGSTYAAASGDSRKLRVMFFDGTGWKTLSPDLTVRSVPYAAVARSAEKLGNYSSTDFLLKAIMPVATCPANNFLTFNGTNMVCSPVPSSGTVTAVTSTNSYLSVASGTSTPALTVNVGTAANTVAAGNDSRIVGALQTGATAGGDLNGTLPSPTVAKIRGVNVATTAPTSGQVLTYDGTNWAPATPSAGGGGSITGVTAGTGLSGGGTSGSVTVNLANTAVTAGSYTRANITVDAQGRLTSAANGSAVNLASDITGTLPIANGGTGQTAKAPAFNALSPLTTKGDLLAFDGTNNIRFNVGTDGQILAADSSQASGLKWISPSTGTVSNVSGTAPIVVTNGSTTPAISVNVATTSTSGVVQVGSGIAVSSGTISADPANFPSAVPVSKGGTGSTSLNANSILMTNGTGTGFTSFNCTIGQTIGFDASGIAGCYSLTSAGIFSNGGNAFGANAKLGTTDTKSLSFITDNNTRMTIDSGGNIGVGTVAPDYKLHISNASTGDDGIKIESSGVAGPELSLKSTDTGGRDYLLISTGSANGPGAGAFGIFDKNAVTYRMVINSSGNMGIGTAAPGYTLDLGGRSDGLRFPAGTTAQQPTANAGVVRYNSDLTTLEYNDGSAWIPFKDKYNSTVFTTSKTLTAADGYQTLNFTPSANSTVTLPATSGLPVGWWVIVADNSANRFLTANTPDGILFDGGSTTFSIPRNGSYYKFIWRGSTWYPSYVYGNGFVGPTGKNMIFSTIASTGSAGSISFNAGNSYEGPGSPISLMSGSANSQTTTTYNGGDISLSAGYGVNNGNGGNITLMAGQSNNGGTGSGNPGNVSIYGGLNNNGHGSILLNPSGGMVGIGVGTATATLDVNGTIKSTAVSNGTSTTIDFSTGNLQYTTSSCGALTLNNMKSGATYTLAVQGAAGGTCSFTASTGVGTNDLTVKTGSVSLTQTAGKHLLITFIVMNTTVYVASIDGY